MDSITALGGVGSGTSSQTQQYLAWLRAGSNDRVDATTRLQERRSQVITPAERVDGLVKTAATRVDLALDSDLKSRELAKQHHVDVVA